MAWQVPSILYDNRYDNGTPVSSGTVDTGYSVLNINDWRSYTYWQTTLSAAGSVYITVDCATAKSADCLGIISHNLGTLGATVSVECSSDNFATDTTVALTGFVPTNDKAILRKFTTQSKRYWRLKITLGAAGSPKLAILCIGSRLDFQYQPETPFDTAEQTVEAELSRSQNGSLLGSAIRHIMVRAMPSWKFITDTWMATYFDPFWNTHASKLKPFFWAWEPGDHPTEIYLVSIPEGFTLSRQYVSPGYRNLNLELVGIAEA